MEKLKILVVDDESRMRKLVGDFLKRKVTKSLRQPTVRRRWIYFLKTRVSVLSSVM